jgi:hypothetical protein
MLVTRHQTSKRPTTATPGTPLHCCPSVTRDAGREKRTRFCHDKGDQKVVIDDILAIELHARAKNGIALSLGIPGNA